MERDGHYETKTYRCGKIGEKVKFYVPASRSGKSKKSSEEKIASNANSATRKAARIINENFRAGDGWITLTYDERLFAKLVKRAAEMDPSMPLENRMRLAAEHELRLCFDRTRRALRKKGVELRYLAVTSDMDPDTGEPVRLHHHVIVPADCAAALKEKWGSKEFQDPERPEWKDRLWEMDDYTPLAEYMMKQVRHIPDAKKYMPSRNLMRSNPKPRKVISGAQLRPPKGCKLLYAAPYTGRRDCQYIRYLLPPEEWTGVWDQRRQFPDPTRRARTSRDKIGNSSGGPS